MGAILVITLLVAFAGFFVWVGVDVRRNLKQQLEALANSGCPLCGKPYGFETAEHARQEHWDRCHAERKARPDCKINFVRYWEVKCPACGCVAEYHYETEKLTKCAS